MKVTIEYYTTKSVKHNWKVFVDGKHVGHLHDLGGIGGQLKEKYMDETFDKACELAKKDLKQRG